VVNTPVPIMLATTNAVALQKPSGRLLASPVHGVKPEPATKGDLGDTSFTLLNFGQALLPASPFVVQTDPTTELLDRMNFYFFFFAADFLLLILAVFPVAFVLADFFTQGDNADKINRLNHKQSTKEGSSQLFALRAVPGSALSKDRGVLR
jgi:hypothetical protein